jgi:hypothetical protein
MQSETKTPPVSAFNMGQLTSLQKRIDQFLDEIYTAFKTFEDDLPTMIRGIFPRHFESDNDPQSQKWTDKEQEDLEFLKSFTDSLPSWDQSLNSVLENPSEKIEGKLQSTLADFEDSNSIALTLQVGIEKINSDHRSLLHSRFSKSPNFLVEVPLDIEKRWVQRLGYLAALRKLHEEVQKELSLSPLNESTLSLPVLLACVEIGELLIRKNRTPRDSWKCDDREIHSLLKLIPKLLHFLPEEKFQIGLYTRDMMRNSGGKSRLKCPGSHPRGIPKASKLRFARPAPPPGLITPAFCLCSTSSTCQTRQSLCHHTSGEHPFPTGLEIKPLPFLKK